MISKIKLVLEQTHMYYHRNMVEGVIVNYCEDESFNATGELTGEEFQIGYFEVDLENDNFYKLQLIDVNAI